MCNFAFSIIELLFRGSNLLRLMQEIKTHNINSYEYP